MTDPVYWASEAGFMVLYGDRAERIDTPAPDHDPWLTAPIDELIDAEMDKPPTRESREAERLRTKAIERRLEGKKPKRRVRRK